MAPLLRKIAPLLGGAGGSVAVVSRPLVSKNWALLEYRSMILSRLPGVEETGALVRPTDGLKQWGCPTYVVWSWPTKESRCEFVGLYLSNRLMILYGAVVRMDWSQPSKKVGTNSSGSIRVSFGDTQLAV